MSKNLVNRLKDYAGIGNVKKALSGSISLKTASQSTPYDERDVRQTWIKQEAGYRIFFNRETEKLDVEFINCTPSEAAQKFMDDILYEMHHAFEEAYMEKFAKENV